MHLGNVTENNGCGILDKMVQVFSHVDLTFKVNLEWWDGENYVKMSEKYLRQKVFKELGS